MRRRIAIHSIGATALITGFLGVLAGPAGAQPGDSFPSPGPSSSGSGGFGALFAIALLVGIGVSIWKFVSLRDMGIRRGMSESDATKAAMFSDDATMLGMVLKDEVKDEVEPRATRSTPSSRSAADGRTIEERLAKVEDLRTRGLISDGQADERKAEILDEI